MGFRDGDLLRQCSAGRLDLGEEVGKGLQARPLSIGTKESPHRDTLCDAQKFRCPFIRSNKPAITIKNKDKPRARDVDHRIKESSLTPVQQPYGDEQKDKHKRDNKSQHRIECAPKEPQRMCRSIE